jgi:hypothetical protein
MPPQQAYGLLDVTDDFLRFGAHSSNSCADCPADLQGRGGK